MYKLYHYIGKRFSKEHSKKSKYLCSGSPRLHIFGCGKSPSGSQLHVAIHIYYVKYENAITCKRNSWDLGVGGNNAFKMFTISYMVSTKSDHLSPKIKLYIHGNRKSNAILYNRDQQPAYMKMDAFDGLLILSKL